MVTRRFLVNADSRVAARVAALRYARSRTKSPVKLVDVVPATISALDSEISCVAGGEHHRTWVASVEY